MTVSSSSSSVRGPELIVGEVFRFGSLAFVADDSARLVDSPLQAQLLPLRGSVHFRADELGALCLQLSAHRQAPALLSVRHKKKRSGRPRTHHRGDLFKVQQVAVIDSVESAHKALDELIAREGSTASLLPLFDLVEEEGMAASDPESGAEQEGSSGTPVAVAEVCMAETPPSQPSPARDTHARDETNNPSRAGTREPTRRVSDFRRLELKESSQQPHPLTREEREEAEAAERLLNTPIDTSTPEGRGLEAARLTNLAERDRLAELENTLERQAREVARLRQSRTSRQLQGPGREPFRAMGTPVENLIAATRIANSLHPSGSAAEEIQHLAFLLQTAVDQNAAVSQSQQRIHSQVPPARTPLSVHTPYGEARRSKNNSPRHRDEPRGDHHQDRYRHENHMRADARETGRPAPWREEFPQHRDDRHFDIEDDAQ